MNNSAIYVFIFLLQTLYILIHLLRKCKFIFAILQILCFAPISHFTFPFYVQPYPRFFPFCHWHMRANHGIIICVILKHYLYGRTAKIWAAFLELRQRKIVSSTCFSARTTIPTWAPAGQAWRCMTGRRALTGPSTISRTHRSAQIGRASCRERV